MIKNIADVTDKLIDLNKKHKEVTKEDQPEYRSRSRTTTCISR